MKYGLAFLISFFVSTSFADPIFRINHGTNQNIDKFGICEKITNSSGTKDIMVPTNTSLEWTSFLAHLPPSTTKGTCYSSPPGTGHVGRGRSNAINSSGKVFLGGDASPYLVRLNSDNTLDATWSVGGTGITSTWSERAVYSMAIQADGKIIIGGDFLSVNGTTTNRIARLNADGTLDTTFATNVGTAAGSAEYIRVDSIFIQSDGKIVVGGNFSSFNGTSGDVIRLNSDGTKDTSFTVPTSKLPETVHGVYVQSDGKVLVGGDSYSDVKKNIVRLNSDGTLDTTFETNKGTSTSGGVVYLVTQLSDGSLLIGGTFTSFNGTSVGRLVHLSSAGVFDSAFNTNIGTGFDSEVDDIAPQSTGKIILVGLFTKFNGVNQKSIVRLNTVGTKDTTFSTGSSGGVDALSIFSDDKIFISGPFCSGFISSGCYSAVLNADGTH
jgi:uncharacterized delta-60 repeat protein